MMFFGILIPYPANSAPQFSCPSHIIAQGSDHPLLDGMVFDGPPADQVDLEGAENGVWDLASLGPTSNPIGFFVVCRYVNTEATITLHMPRTTSKCIFSGLANHIKMECQ